MVLAVPERGHLEDAWIPIPIRLELLRKYRMCHGRVGRRRPAVCDHETLISSRLEEILEVRTDRLYRECVDRLIVTVLPDLLDPDATTEFGVVVLEHVHESIEKE